jgi:hypothetical protein
MKVKISDKETYEIIMDLDKEWSVEEFSAFVDRMNRVTKLLSLASDVIKPKQDNKDKPKKRSSSKKYKFDTIEKATEYIKEFDSFSDKESRFKALNEKYHGQFKDHKVILDKYYYLKRKFNLGDK